jgi:hypothetical protein
VPTHITVFLPDDHEDDSLKFELLIEPSYNDEILKYLHHKDFNAMSPGLWDLTPEQVAYISELVGQPLPMDLEMLIGVVRAE